MLCGGPARPVLSARPCSTRCAGREALPPGLDPARVKVGDRALVLLSDAARLSREGVVTDEALLATMILDRKPGLAGNVLWWLGVGPSWGRALTQMASQNDARDDGPPFSPEQAEVVGGLGPDEGWQRSFQPSMKVPMAAIRSLTL